METVISDLNKPIEIGSTLNCGYADGKSSYEYPTFTDSCI